MAVADSRKTVLITGCSPGGIGHSLALEFHSKGLHVIATARSTSSLTSLADVGITTLPLEVTSAESIASAVSSVSSLTNGKLDILVNNAGRNYTVPGVEVDLDEVRQTFETNVVSVIAITQAFVPMLIESKGLIVNVGSLAAIIPYVFGSVYNASKAALHAYSSTLRLELEPFGVRVQVIITGGVQSRIARTKRTLARDSLYLDIEADYDRRISHSQDGAMPNQIYAQGVVREALKAAPKKWVWRGNRTLLVWFVYNWVGSWLFDRILPKMFGLDRLWKIVKSRKKTA